MVTTDDGSAASQLPQDLESVNIILQNTLQELQQSLDSNGTQVNTTVSTGTRWGYGNRYYNMCLTLVQGVIELLNNLLDERNLPGWSGLQEQNSPAASEQLLDNAEDYGLYVARALQTPGDVSVLSRPNIGTI